MFKKNKKLREECWNIDYSFIHWLNGHLKIFKEDAGQVIDLEYHRISYKDEKYSLLELVDKMITLTDYLKNENNYYFPENEEDTINKTNELLDLFKASFFYLWW